MVESLEAQFFVDANKLAPESQGTTCGIKSESIIVNTYS